MFMKAIWNGKIIANSTETLVIEGNQYFPPKDIYREYLHDSDFHTTCPWKGEASYYSITVDGQENENAAWYYPTPKPTSLEVVGKDYSNYVAFWQGVNIA